jgi:hypothetical protein
MVDRFVVFDHVQAMRGKSWLTRNRILVQGEPHWLTLPVHRSATGLPAVDEVRVQWENPAVAKQLRTLRAEYGRHPFFDEVFALVEELYEAQPPLIAGLNERFFATVLERIGHVPELVTSRSLVARDPSLAELHGNELVVALCKAAGAEEYVSGAGCFDFIRPDTFEAEGVEFWVQAFDHPVYEQRRASEFVSHLSVLDALFNLGFDGVAGLVERPARERMAT